jgi:hypothetical protein
MEQIMGRERRGWLAGFLLVAAAAVALAAPSAGKIVEPETERGFAATVQGAEDGRTLTCTGVACRKKTMLGVKVYAVAHWIDAAAAAQALAPWKGKPASELVKDQSFYDALSSVDVEKRMRLEFVHDATAKQVADGFRDSLELTYKKLPPEAERFLGMLQEKMELGDAVELRWLPGGNIELYEKDQLKGVVEENPTFATAAWKMWLGEKLADGHLETAKKDLVGNIAAVWEAP